MDRSRDEVWTECLGIIRDNISRQSFRTWFEPLRAVGLEEADGETKLTVQLPSRFYYEWLEEHYFGLLRKTITKVLGPGGRLYYDIVIERDEPAPGGTRKGSSMELPARQPSNVPPPASERPPTPDLPVGVTPPRPPSDARPDTGRGGRRSTPVAPAPDRPDGRGGPPRPPVRDPPACGPSRWTRTSTTRTRSSALSRATATGLRAPPRGRSRRRPARRVSIRS